MNVPGSPARPVSARSTSSPSPTAAAIRAASAVASAGVRKPRGPGQLEDFVALNRTATQAYPFCTPRRVEGPEVPGMTDTMIVELGLQAMTIAAQMCAPVLLTALAVGFAI